MTIFKRRTRIVSFRLSEDEYEQIRAVCIANGVRSISDFARGATRNWALNLPDESGDLVRAKMLQLDEKISELDGKFRKLNQLLEGM